MLLKLTIKMCMYVKGVSWEGERSQPPSPLAGLGSYLGWYKVWICHPDAGLQDVCVQLVFLNNLSILSLNIKRRENKHVPGNKLCSFRLIIFI